MLKLRLKRTGRKGSPSYRLVIMKNTTRRNGRPIEEVGYYNPITKKSFFDIGKIKKWLRYGVKPTQTVLDLLRRADINIEIVQNDPENFLIMEDHFNNSGSELKFLLHRPIF